MKHISLSDTSTSSSGEIVSLDDVVEHEETIFEPETQLTEEEFQTIPWDIAMDSVETALMSEKKNRNFYQNFRDSAWYSNYTVNIWSNYLLQVYNKKGTFWVDSIWVSKLHSKFTKGESKDSSMNAKIVLDSVLTESVAHFHLNECEMLLIPVNVKNNHWLLLIACNLHNLKVGYFELFSWYLA